MFSPESLPGKICQLRAKNGQLPQEFKEEFPAYPEGAGKKFWLLTFGGPEGVSSSVSLVERVNGLEVILAALKLFTGPHPGLRLYLQKIESRGEGTKATSWLVHFWYDDQGNLHGPGGLSFPVEKHQFSSEIWRVLEVKLPSKIDFEATVGNLFSACGQQASPSRKNLLVVKCRHL